MSAHRPLDCSMFFEFWRNQGRLKRTCNVLANADIGSWAQVRALGRIGVLRLPDASPRTADDLAEGGGWAPAKPPLANLSATQMAAELRRRGWNVRAPQDRPA